MENTSSSYGQFTAHKLASIVPMIEAIGASVICLSPYSRLL
jgi:hypothetical protein